MLGVFQVHTRVEGGGRGGGWADERAVDLSGVGVGLGFSSFSPGDQKRFAKDSLPYSRHRHLISNCPTKEKWRRDLTDP